MHNPVTGAWQRFDDALNDGYSTAVAGWYNPYCRILPQVLDRCFWTLRMAYPGGMVPGQSVLANVRTQLTHRLDAMSFLLSSYHPESAGFDLETKLHVADYIDLRNATDSMLDDSAANFLFLHMPLPHPLGIYNRQHGVLTTRSTSYIDNPDSTTARPTSSSCPNSNKARVSTHPSKRSTRVLFSTLCWQTSYIRPTT